MLQYFCGGPMDGRAFTVAEITDSNKYFTVSPADYRWTHNDVTSSLTKEIAWVWVWIHEPDVTNLPPVRVAFASWEKTMTLVETVWRKADNSFARLAEINASTNTLELDVNRERVRERLNTLCEILAMFMSPHFRTAKEIAEELKRRYEAKMGDEAYETKGLGSRSVEFDRTPTQPKKASTPAATAKTAGKQLSDEDKQSIRFGHGSGMFTNSELAKTYGVSEAVILQVISG